MDDKYSEIAAKDGVTGDTIKSAISAMREDLREARAGRALDPEGAKDPRGKAAYARALRELSGKP